MAEGEAVLMAVALGLDLDRDLGFDLGWGLRRVTVWRRRVGGGVVRRVRVGVGGPGGGSGVGCGRWGSGSALGLVVAGRWGLDGQHRRARGWDGGPRGLGWKVC